MVEFFNNNKNYFYAFGVLLVLSVAYLPGVFSGKGLPQSDIIQHKGAASEATEYAKKGEKILWTNSQFSGMPTYQITGAISQNPMNVFRLPKKPLVWDKIFLLLACSFVMFISFKVKPWLSLVGAVAVAFTSNNMIIIHSGHNTQALAIAYLPLVIAGVQFLFRKKWFIGFNVLALGMALQLLVNHVQITYYTGIIVGIFMLVKLFTYIQNKDLSTYLKVCGLALVAVILAAGSSAMNLMLSKEYAKYTIRGKSDLSIDPVTKAPKEKAPSSGLDFDYAFQWSNGWADLGATIIPNYAGGGSSTDLGEGSVFEGMLQAQAIKNFPFAYWGALPFTEGPIYFGAAMFFLCVFGFLMVKSNLRWWLLAAILLSLMMSTGKNHFTWLNHFLFDHFPLYNIFRAPTMALVIAQVCVPLIGILGLNAFFNSKEVDSEDKKKSLKIAGIATIALLTLLTFQSGIFTDFQHKLTNEQGAVVKDYDQEVFQQYKIEPAKLIEARKDLIKKDGMRSIFIVILVFAVLWFYNKGKLKMPLSLAVIGVIILFDLWSVDKRYLNGDELVSKSSVENPVNPSQVDLAIMQDKSYYRVLDLRGNPMSNARTSYFHHSLGGYHAAKIRRYQELFDWHISGDLTKGNLQNSPYLNMLNMKYAIYENQQSGQESYMKNENANGNAWVVFKADVVPNADSALFAMNGFDSKQEIVIEKREAEKMKVNLSGLDSTARVTLTSYHPEEMVYESNSSQPGIAVFSEIYYEKGWQAYLDNNPVPHYQVNYVLRAMDLPAGKHTIRFKFEPKTYQLSKTISYASSGLIILILLGSIALYFYNERKGAS